MKFITITVIEYELLGLYRQYYNKIPIGTSMYKVEQQIEKLEKELEEEQKDGGEKKWIEKNES